LKKLFVKAGLIAIAMGLSIENSSATGYLFSDTNLTFRIALPEKTKEPKIICANVIFPSIFRNHEEQSIKYIEQFSSTRKQYLIRTYHKSRKYFPKATQILLKYDVPREFVVLMALESGFNANARSRAGAVGYWQFMDKVAKEYGLKIAERKSNHRVHKSKKKVINKTSRRDDRKDFNKSTHAAARYLKDRSKNLNNDWLLIAASYNWGIGNVWNAMERTGKPNPTFWDIKKYLPAETKAYVMNFIALNVIFHNYENFLADNMIFTDSEVKENKLQDDNCDELSIAE
jgi:hypothetical protein